MKFYTSWKSAYMARKCWHGNFQIYRLDLKHFTNEFCWHWILIGIVISFFIMFKYLLLKLNQTGPQFPVLLVTWTTFTKSIKQDKEPHGIFFFVTDSIHHRRKRVNSYIFNFYQWPNFWSDKSTVQIKQLPPLCKLCDHGGLLCWWG